MSKTPHTANNLQRWYAHIGYKRLNRRTEIWLVCAFRCWPEAQKVGVDEKRNVCRSIDYNSSDNMFQNLACLLHFMSCAYGTKTAIAVAEQPTKAIIV